MAVVGVHETKTRLSKLLQRVSAGEEIVITRNGDPVAKLVPITPTEGRRLGVDDGVFEVPADFDAPLPAELLDAFET